MAQAAALEHLLIKNPNPALFPLFETAFHTPTSLGIICIKMPANHPFHAQRSHLLGLAPTLAHLPAKTLANLEHPQSKHSFGWSHGKELMNGRPDIAKGSFYAQIYEPERPKGFQTTFPAYGFKNVWPTPQDMNGDSLEEAFVALGKTITETGIHLARQMDAYLKSKHPTTPLSSLESALSSPQNCHKGRLLHYFPVTANASDTDNGSWCGLHLDHSLLTGLTRAIVSPEPPATTSSPSGLFVQLPDGSFTPVDIPEDCIAFQIGQAASVLSRGVLKATPHLVKAGEVEGVERSTFACFLQPDPEFELNEGLSFGRFSEEILLEHY
ncbi:hypothetical protein HDU98_000346 [Podochytrium sp. JEL0797]|nr:hypothetical protein HDU98_000346 [Podochytrium sp. JEL0797]